jgi:hypothetical protein
VDNAFGSEMPDTYFTSFEYDRRKATELQVSLSRKIKDSAVFEWVKPKMATKFE